MNLESAFQVSNFNANTTNSFDMKIDFDDDLLTDEVRPTNRKRSAEEIMKCAKHLKTQKKYDKCWEDFMKFHEEPKIESLNEEMFLQYFDFLIETKSYAYSTLWSIFSMLNSESQIRCGPKMNDYFRLITLIKSKETDINRNKEERLPRKILKLHLSSIISSEPSSSSRNNPSHETLNQKTMHISNCSNVVINFWKAYFVIVNTY